MALTPQQKALRELEGDSPELVAWALMEWIRLVEGIDTREGLLDAYADSLKTAQQGVAAAAAVAGDTMSGEGVNGTQRRLAFKLVHLISDMEGRAYGQRNQGDRAWIKATYKDCLDTVLGKRVAVVVAEAAGEVAAAG